MRKGLGHASAMVLAGLIALGTAAPPALAQSPSALSPGVETEWLAARPRPVLNTDPSRLPSRDEALAAIE